MLFINKTNSPMSQNIDDDFQLAEKYIKSGEGSLLTDPYSRKIYKYLNFKTPNLALKSAKKIYREFKHSLQSDMPLIQKYIQTDTCRKFLQIGYNDNMKNYYGKKNKKKNHSESYSIHKYIAYIYWKYLQAVLNNDNYQNIKKNFYKMYNKKYEPQK